MISNESLNLLRHEGDDWADPFVENIITSHSEKYLLHLLHGHVGELSENVPDELQKQLAIARQLPLWVDAPRLEKASEFFQRNKGIIVIILATASLVECYACKNGVKVLAYTSRLSDDTYNRVVTTADFILKVMTPKKLGKGDETTLELIQKIRLVHAMVRYHIKNSNLNEKETPINQEDLLGTLFSFSTVVIRNLRKFGVAVSKEEAEDYYYFWRVIGVLLGIKEEVLPDSFNDAIALETTVFGRNQESSDQGVDLTLSLIGLLKKELKFKPLNGIIPALIRFQVGDKVADWMKVPKTGWIKLFQPKRKHWCLLKNMVWRTNLLSLLLDKMGRFYLRNSHLVQDKH
ncbi:oxygenase MpaB family protein [Halobacillus sp. MO56]